ncbi:MAG: PQQ-binding-like beta-propeller repeat protein [Phycisphaerales bacterium]|nr:MAG: PQQ-binding-like beta-propeller repeat protein [Phycisphaerales bacterium]
MCWDLASTIELLGLRTQQARVLTIGSIVFGLALHVGITPADATDDVRGDDASWPMFHGDAQLSGVAASALPEQLAVRWKFEAPDAILTSAAIVDGVVYVGCADEHFYALDLTDGSVKWKYRAEGMVQSSPLVMGQLVLFGDEVGVLHAVDRINGRKKWSFQTEGQLTSSPNGHADRIVVGSYDAHVYCLARDTGKLIWKYQTDGYLHGSPAIGQGHVLAAGCDEKLHVVRMTDGQAVRTIPLHSVTGASPAISGSRAYVGSYGGIVLAIDWQAGKVLWTFDDPETEFPYMTCAAVTGERIIVAGRDRRMRSLDPATGKSQWDFVAKGRIDSSPVIVGERVFVGSDDGNLYSVHLRTGKELWRFETGAPITVSPAIASGCLVIGNDDGVVYCFSKARTTGS